MVEHLVGGRNWGIDFGSLSTGTSNCITDVAGVQVGHFTLASGDVQTGLTLIRPQPGNMFRNKLAAGVAVLNGFGKSVGLLQVDELGVIETPILLTNTFSVAAGLQGLLDIALAENPEIGVTTGTVNPIVMECNDQYLNAIRRCVLQPEDVRKAMQNCSTVPPQGAIGAGRGMSCFGFKGGIGSSSRIVICGAERFSLGVLVLSNFGAPGWLQHQGICFDNVIPKENPAPERGSVIVVAAVDAPCDSRQLKRLAARSGMGLARTGSYMGHGSGDIALAFSTARAIAHNSDNASASAAVFHESYMDQLFQAMVLAVEEAVWNSLTYAETVVGFQGHTRVGISCYRHHIMGRC